MIIVHHLNNSRSQRVLWLLEELGQPYDIVRYQRDPATLLAPPGLAKVHPLGKSPVVTDGELTLAETGAIVEYLVDAYGAGLDLRPERGTAAGYRYTYWLHFAEGSAMPPLLLKLVLDTMANAPMPFFARPIARRLTQRVLDVFVRPTLVRQLAWMESELQARGPWFAGPHFSAADVQMSFPLEAARQRAGLDAATTPGLAAWLDRIHARPAYRRALERGGAYDFAS